MSKFLGIILGVVGVAALVGAAIGWRFPFLGQSRSSNQLETAQQAPTAGQPATRTRVQRANQPTTTTQAQNPQRTAQAPAGAQTQAPAQVNDPTIDPEGTAGTGTAQTNPGGPVRALW
ncbi:MAG: hypothetical protein F6K28_24585 [Microcoleus sp. SIO2G3]|nr:hypothetical protein [Microcoleus sp. SIO2G3]